MRCLTFRFLALWISSLPVAAGAEPACPPSALLQGPPAIAIPTAAILRQHGVRSEAPSCRGRTVRASFTASADPNVHTLLIHDGFGRISERHAGDPETAASLIESWLLDEDAALLTPKPEAAAPPTVAAVAVVDRPLEPTFIRAPGAMPPWRFFAGAELSSTTDEDRWYAVSGAFCRSLGPLCVGGRGRMAREEGWQTPNGVEMRTAGGDGLLLTAVPVRVGRLTVLPSAGVGLGWTRFAALRQSGETSRERLFLRGELSLILDLRIVHGWSVFAEVGATGAEQIAGEDWESGPSSTRRTSVASLRTGLGIGYAP